MTPKDTLEALAGRVEAATGADRELDAEIALAIGAAGNNMLADRHAKGWCVGGIGQPHLSLAYTASLDAARTLVPDDADSGGERYRLEEWVTNGVHAEHVRASAWVAGAPRVFAATPALALTAAALRARAQEVR